MAICIPGTTRIYCFPIHARLHLAGKGQKSEATLAKEMLDSLEWCSDRKLVFLGDGAYSMKNLLGDLDPRVNYVGVMRADAAIFDPMPPKQSKSRRGPKAKKGRRLPIRRRQEKAEHNPVGADLEFGKRSKPRLWRDTQVASGLVSGGLARVRGLGPILVVLVRDPRGKFQDK